jgi:hypothetical protein
MLEVVLGTEEAPFVHFFFRKESLFLSLVHHNKAYPV